MPKKRRTLTPEERQYVLDSLDRISYVEMARTLGMSTDTLKRILHRERIREFDAAKFVAAEDIEYIMWERPCMDCKDTTPRPKWIYYCEACSLKRFGPPTGD
jgi:transposase-like protein